MLKCLSSQRRTIQLLILLKTVDFFLVFLFIVPTASRIFDSAWTSSLEVNQFSVIFVTWWALWHIWSNCLLWSRNRYWVWLIIQLFFLQWKWQNTGSSSFLRMLPAQLFTKVHICIVHLYCLFAKQCSSWLWFDVYSASFTPFSFLVHFDSLYDDFLLHSGCLLVGHCLLLQPSLQV